METITKYKSSDGLFFDDKEECYKHESTAKLTELISELTDFEVPGGTDTIKKFILKIIKKNPESFIRLINKIFYVEISDDSSLDFLEDDDNDIPERKKFKKPRRKEF